MSSQPIILSTRQQALLEQIASRTTNSYTEDLQHQILDFIDYFNRTLAKPFVWKFVGFPESD